MSEIIETHLESGLDGSGARNRAEVRGFGLRGSATKEDITGAAVVDVAGHDAAVLTLTGDATIAAWTGWTSDTNLHQRLRVEVVQDATGGHLFDWTQVEGNWAERPPDPSALDLFPGDTSLQFYASTVDGGATVALEPIGIAYVNECIYAQIVTTAVPAVPANGSAAISHSFDRIGSVDLTEVATGRRVLADWQYAQSGDPSSPIEILFSFAAAAGEFEARIVGQSDQPCELTVSVSEWITLDLSLNGASAISPRVNFTGAPGDIEWIWGDGSAPEAPVSGVATNHTYTTPFSGTATLRYRRGVTINQFESVGDPWNFNLSALSGETGLTFLRLDGTQVVGDVSALGDMDQVSTLYLFGLSGVTGDVGSLSGLTSLSQFWAFSTGVSGDIGGLSGIASLNYIHLSNTSVSGDIGSLGTIAGLERIQLSNTNVSGDITPLSSLSNLIELRAINTTIAGDVVALSGQTAMTALQVNATSLSGTTSSIAPLSNLRVLEIADTGISGTVDVWSSLTLLTTFRVNNTPGIIGDPSIVAVAAPNLVTFIYVFTGVLPTAPQLDAVIAALAAGTVSNGTLSIASSNPPITNTTGVATLQGRGWSVSHN